MLILDDNKYLEIDSADSLQLPICTPAYEEVVVSFIREKYTLTEELALQRQRDTKPEEFEAYFNYCEDCKKRAREL